MNIAVLLKSVPDTASVITIGEDQKSFAIDNPKYIINPYDEYALEEAVKLKEAFGGEVVAVSLGREEHKKTMRDALAVGADKAVFIKEKQPENLSGKGISKLLAAALKSIAADIIVAGKQSVDDDSSQVAERVAEILNIAHASVVTRIDIKGQKAEVDRDVEGGHLVMEIPLPALFTVEKGINTPRYPTLPNILKAKRKEIKEIQAVDLGIPREELGSAISINKVSAARQNRQATILKGALAPQVKELVSILRQEKITLS